jgi:hypothetical protein
VGEHLGQRASQGVPALHDTITALWGGAAEGRAQRLPGRGLGRMNCVGSIVRPDPEGLDDDDEMGDIRGGKGARRKNPKKSRNCDCVRRPTGVPGIVC